MRAVDGYIYNRYACCVLSEFDRSTKVLVCTDYYTEINPLRCRHQCTTFWLMFWFYFEVYIKRVAGYCILPCVLFAQVMVTSHAWSMSRAFWSAEQAKYQEGTTKVLTMQGAVTRLKAENARWCDRKTSLPALLFWIFLCLMLFFSWWFFILLFFCFLFSCCSFVFFCFFIFLCLVFLVRVLFIACLFSCLITFSSHLTVDLVALFLIFLYFSLRMAFTTTFHDTPCVFLDVFVRQLIFWFPCGGHLSLGVFFIFYVKMTGTCRGVWGNVKLSWTVAFSFVLFYFYFDAVLHDIWQSQSIWLFLRLLITCCRPWNCLSTLTVRVRHGLLVIAPSAVQVLLLLTALFTAAWTLPLHPPRPPHPPFIPAHGSV